MTVSKSSPTIQGGVTTQWVTSEDIYPCGRLGKLNGFRWFRHSDDSALPGAGLNLSVGTPALKPAGQAGAPVPGDDTLVASIIDEATAVNMPADGKTSGPASTFDVGEFGRLFDGLKVSTRVFSAVAADVPTAERYHYSVIMWGWVND